MSLARAGWHFSPGWLALSGPLKPGWLYNFCSRTRPSLMKDGRVLLQKLYNQPGLSGPDNASQPGEKCHPARAKDIQTLFGTIQASRSYFYQPETQTGRFPLDQAL